MCAKLLGFLLFACQIIFNRSHVIREATDDDGTPTLASASSNLPEGYVRFPDLHAAYKLHEESIVWTEARDRCIAEGAQLAVADTVQKIERIHAMTPEVGDWISVGIQKSNTTGEWVRIDNNLPLKSLPWTEGNPDDDGSCAAISMIQYALYDCPCDSFPNWFVCEIPI